LRQQQNTWDLRASDTWTNAIDAIDAGLGPGLMTTTMSHEMDTTWA
jgi:hypothetical protein